MTTQGILSDTSCESLGYVQTPSRGSYKSIRTCYPVMSGSPCQTIAIIDVRSRFDIRAFGVESATQPLLVWRFNLKTLSAVDSSVTRFATALLKPQSVDEKRIYATFTDATQTVLEVGIEDNLSNTLDMANTPFYVEVCECANTRQSVTIENNPF